MIINAYSEIKIERKEKKRRRRILKLFVYYADLFDVNTTTDVLFKKQF